MTPTQASRRHRAAIAVVCGLALTACGSADDADIATSDPTPGSTAARVDVPSSDTPATEPDAPAATVADTYDGTPAPAADAPDTIVVPTALQFSAPLVGGGQIDASTLAGKPTVFWFWAPT